MARPEKTGLDYGNVDVDIFADPKVEFICAKFGAEGDGIFFRLLCKIWREGYYIRFTEDESLLIARAIGDNSRVNLVNSVVNELVFRGFFDATIYEKHQILTSKGLQKRYIKICNNAGRKNISILSHICLVDSSVGKFTLEKPRLTPEETALTPEFSTQSKVKESKVKESKVKESTTTPPLPPSCPPEETDRTTEEKTVGSVGVVDADLAKVIRAWDKASARVMTEREGEMLKCLLDEYKVGAVLDAINIMAKNGKSTLAYLDGILRKKASPNAGPPQNKGQPRSSPERTKDTWLDEAYW